jgi:hypothetical protein
MAGGAKRTVLSMVIMVDRPAGTRLLLGKQDRASPDGLPKGHEAERPHRRDCSPPMRLTCCGKFPIMTHKLKPKSDDP